MIDWCVCASVFAFCHHPPMNVWPMLLNWLTKYENDDDDSKLRCCASVADDDDDNTNEDPDDDETNDDFWTEILDTWITPCRVVSVWGACEWQEWILLKMSQERNKYEIIRKIRTISSIEREMIENEVIHEQMPKMISIITSIPQSSSSTSSLSSSRCSSSSLPSSTLLLLLSSTTSQLVQQLRV